MHTTFWLNNLKGIITWRLQRRCEDNIRLDLREIGCEYVDWIQLTQDRGQWRAVVNTIMNLGII
jgi:hypothetical protein